MEHFLASPASFWFIMHNVRRGESLTEENVGLV
jgi:hypothetical protein